MDFDEILCIRVEITMQNLIVQGPRVKNSQKPTKIYENINNSHLIPYKFPMNSPVIP